MSDKKEDFPEYYMRKRAEKKNVTHSVHQWEDWVELCEAYDEDPYTCYEINLGLDGGNWTGFEYKGDVPELDA